MRRTNEPLPEGFLKAISHTHIGKQVRHLVVARVTYETLGYSSAIGRAPGRARDDLAEKEGGGLATGVVATTSGPGVKGQGDIANTSVIFDQCSRRKSPPLLPFTLRHLRPSLRSRWGFIETAPRGFRRRA